MKRLICPADEARAEALADPGNYDCTCGRRITLIPVRDYMGENWYGCHIKGACQDCPLNQDVDRLVSVVIEKFGP